MAASDFLRVTKRLAHVVDDLIEPAMKKTVLHGERILKREMPVKRGTLRRSATGRVELRGRRGVVGTNLGYARSVNDGSKPHIIRPKRGKALVWPGARHPVRSVNHPGNRPNDFMGRTATQLRPIAEREFAAAGNKALGNVS